jgi:hypothetical protein
VRWIWTWREKGAGRRERAGRVVKNGYTTAARDNPLLVGGGVHHRIEERADACLPIPA